MRDYPPGNVVGGGSQPGYLGCAHFNCSKKVRTTELGHDCCGGVKHDTQHWYDDQPEPEPQATVGDLFGAIGDVLRTRFGKRG